ncbi:thiaminase II [SAR202 cluster bacterium AC-409-J13_OGT_754m]|nr:thiaminase II [SAR202 cluster bacterium AC-409-J13_OGT_754m]
MTMSYTKEIEARAVELRQAILTHPFITGIGDGTLDVESFKFYIRQDYLYLIDYSRVLAIASSRSPDLASMGWFADLLNQTLNHEMDLHRAYCAQFGISKKELEETKIAPATLAYTRFLLTLASDHSYPELIAGLLPCQWGYWEIGNQLSLAGMPQNAPLYQQWIQMYSALDFKGLAFWIRDLVDEVAQTQNKDTLAKMENAYRLSLKYEYSFWDMSYKKETWSV